jgi:hypothetical protein
MHVVMYGRWDGRMVDEKEKVKVNVSSRDVID